MPVKAPGEAGAGTPSSDDGTASADDASSSDSSDLDALLAGMGGDDSTGADAASGDGESASSEEAAATDEADTGMDPELAALLKSLE